MSKIALGLYTVFDAINENLLETLKAVAKMGYDGVELFGPRSWPSKEVKSALEETGLALCGWHIEWNLLQPDTIEETIAYCNDIKLPVVIVPALGGPWNIGHTSQDNNVATWKHHAMEMNAIAQKLAEHGMQLGYHTHAHEFYTKFDDVSIWNILCEDLLPNVILELDTGNCIEGGGVPQEVLAKMNNHLGLLHLKPFSHENEFEVVLGAQDDCNNWEAILKQSAIKQINWLVVEDEAQGDKLAISEQCLVELKRILIKL